jgi:hypothetical protein
MSLLLSFYNLNSLEFICIGFLFLIGSVVCINMLQNVKKLKVQKISSYLSIFNFFNDFVSFIFMRKQNLNTQSNFFSSTRIYKKKSE